MVFVLSSNFSFRIQDKFLFYSVLRKDSFSCPLTYISFVRGRLDGNPNLCMKISCDDEEDEDKGKTYNNVVVPVVASIVSVLVLLLGEVVALWIFKKRQQQGILLRLVGYFNGKSLKILIIFTMI